MKKCGKNTNVFIQYLKTSFVTVLGQDTDVARINTSTNKCVNVWVRQVFHLEADNEANNVTYAVKR